MFKIPKNRITFPQIVRESLYLNNVPKKSIKEVKTELTWFETPGLRGSPSIKNALIYANKSLENTMGKALKFMFSVVQPHKVDMDNVKDEVWADLSAVYYKYEDEDQKKAFREVVYEISDKIKDGRWNTIYKKLYRSEKKPT